MAKNRTVYLLSLCGAALFYIFYLGYLSYFIFFATLLLPLVSLLLSLPTLGREQVTVTADPVFVALGEAVTFSVQITTGGLFPPARLQLRLLLRNERTGETQTERIYFSPVQGTQTLRHTCPSVHCGALSLQAVRLYRYDFLGLFRLSRKCKALPALAIIHPVLTPLALSAPAGRTPDAEGSRYSETKPGDDPSELFSFRDYQDGDRFSRIHWKLSGRLGRTIVKEFGFPLTESLFLFLHLDGSPDDNDKLLQAAFSLCAALEQQQIPCRLHYYSMSRKMPCEAVVDDSNDLYGVLHQVLPCAGPFPEDFFAEGGGEPTRGGAFALLFCTTLPAAFPGTLEQRFPFAAWTAVLPDTPEESTAPADIRLLSCETLEQLFEEPDL